jgi:hypothetical protein
MRKGEKKIIRKEKGKLKKEKGKKRNSPFFL